MGAGFMNFVFLATRHLYFYCVFCYYVLFGKQSDDNDDDDDVLTTEYL